jgi:hypothetical protein
VPTRVASGTLARRGSGYAEPPPAVDIVCLADMEWDYAVWTNRQHVMSRLPELASNVRVLYVAPPRFVVSELVRRRQLGQDRLRRSATRLGGGLWRVGERLWVLQPRIPVSNTAATRRARSGYCNWIGRRVQLAAGRLGMVRPVVWSYSPLGGLISRRLRPRARVYDVVDDYSALGHYRRLLGDDAAPLDAEATAAADLVFVTSRRLGRQRRLLNERCVEMGNAADIDLFATARGALPRPPDLGAATGPLVCFHGTLGDQKLDAGLLARIALRRPGWTFAILGHEPDGGARAQLDGVANVRLLGLKPQQELPAYLAAADAVIVPYRTNDYTLGIDALKAYECLAAGVPVVATDLPCFAGLGPQIRTCRADAEFDLALAETIATPPPPVPLRRLEAYTWSAKASRQLAEVQSLVAEVAS